MRVERLWLTDFRNYESSDVSPAPGLTVVVGDNGEGKTNLLEAVGYLATLGSFRGAPRDALVREGSARAIVRAEIDRAPENRRSTIEAELALAGRDRVLVNRQTLRRARDLLGALRVVVFSPDDLALVKGGPAERRRYLDDTMVAADSRLDAVRDEFERVLRQRNALLRQAAAAGGRLSGDLTTTLEVWDERLAGAGAAAGRARVGHRRDRRRAGPAARRHLLGARRRSFGRARRPPAGRAGAARHYRRRAGRRACRSRGAGLGGSDRMTPWQPD